MTPRQSQIALTALCAIVALTVALGPNGIFWLVIVAGIGYFVAGLLQWGETGRFRLPTWGERDEPLPSPTRPWPRPPASPALLACPHCAHRFPFTWGRYFKSNGFTVKCPQCGEKSRLAWTRPYTTFILIGTAFCFLLQGTAAVITGLVAGRIVALSTMLTALLCASVLFLCIIVPLDKRITVRYRPLVKRRAKP